MKKSTVEKFEWKNGAKNYHVQLKVLAGIAAN